MKKELEDKKYYLDVVDNLKFAEMYFEANEMESLVEYLFTPPTQEEVCEALSVELDDNVILFSGDFVAVNRGRVVVGKFDNGEILIQISFKPHLITLIASYYQSLEEENDY